MISTWDASYSAPSKANTKNASTNTNAQSQSCEEKFREKTPIHAHQLTPQAETKNNAISSQKQHQNLSPSTTSKVFEERIVETQTKEVRSPEVFEERLGAMEINVESQITICTMVRTNVTDLHKKYLLLIGPFKTILPSSFYPSLSTA